MSWSVQHYQVSTTLPLLLACHRCSTIITIIVVVLEREREEKMKGERRKYIYEREGDKEREKVIKEEERGRGEIVKDRAGVGSVVFRGSFLSASQ